MIKRYYQIDDWENKMIEFTTIYAQGCITPIVYVLQFTTAAKSWSRMIFGFDCWFLPKFHFEPIPFVIATLSYIIIFTKHWPPTKAVWLLPFTLQLPCPLDCYLTATKDCSNEGITEIPPCIVKVSHRL